MLDSFFHLLWGLKTTAIFDIWSIEHIVSGLSVGHIVKKHHHKQFDKIIGTDHNVHSWHFNLVAVLGVAYAWETIEHYLETGLAGERVAYWFQGTEFWANRIIADPAMLVLGYVLIRKYPGLVIPARIFSAVWLLVHIFVFPHSMYLQQWLGI